MHFVEAKTKKMIFFIGAIFVGVIFLTSYAAFGNNNSGNASTTTVKAAAPQPTIFATGYANAVVTGYAQVADVKPKNNANSTLNTLDALMSKLEANGSIDNYVYMNNSYDVYSSSLSAYALQGFLDSALNSSNSVTVGSTADILLPASISMVLYQFEPSGERSSFRQELHALPKQREEHRHQPQRDDICTHNREGRALQQPVEDKPGIITWRFQAMRGN